MYQSQQYKLYGIAIDFIQLYFAEDDIEIITKFSKISHVNDPLFDTLIKYDLKASNMYNMIYYKNNREQQRN